MRANQLLLLPFAIGIVCSVLVMLQGESYLKTYWSASNLLMEDKYFAPVIKKNNISLDLDVMNHTSLKIENGDIQICFLVSIFGKWASTVDRIQNVTNKPISKSTSVRFFAWTNLHHLHAPGWTRVVKQFPAYRRFITQSRWPKFLAWKDPMIRRNCRVVFYMDSIGEIIGTPNDFQQAAKDILRSQVGHAQYVHPSTYRKIGGALNEFKRIRRARKDLPENINASIAWLKEQPDFSENCTLYENRYFGYSVDSKYFQNASQFLWDRYSLEKDSWRDQPLWCYVLDHFNITPIPLDHQRLFRLNVKRMGKRKHRYGKDSEMEAHQKRQDQLKRVGAIKKSQKPAK